MDSNLTEFDQIQIVEVKTRHKGQIRQKRATTAKVSHIETSLGQLTALIGEKRAAFPCEEG